MSENSKEKLRRVLFVGWIGPPAETAKQARDAIADAVAEALAGEYGDLDWIRDLPVKAEP